MKATSPAAATSNRLVDVKVIPKGPEAPLFLQKFGNCSEFPLFRPCRLSPYTTSNPLENRTGLRFSTAVSRVPESHRHIAGLSCLMHLGFGRRVHQLSEGQRRKAPKWIRSMFRDLI